MATYEYTGVSIYVKNNEDAADRLRLLADALYVTADKIADMSRDLLEDATRIQHSESFQLLEEFAGYFAKEDYYFPRNTPKEYQELSVKPVEINGVHLLKLYFPITSERRNDLILNDCLLPVLNMLFGRDLLSVKVKNGLEHDNFNDLKIQIIKSVNN